MKFLRDVRVEMGKVTWPTRKDLAQSTLVVLVAVAIAAVYTLVVDQAFLRVVNFFVNLIT
ncbi:MAG: preprotein translocase subunit SecE [Actinobacteria bacterium]|nr:preprotein translocase subunit SecE [Actinomycetota bacterium]